MDRTAVQGARGFARSGVDFGRGMLRHFQVLVLGGGFGALEVYERARGDVVILPSWLIWTGIGGSVLVAAVWSYHDLRKRSLGSGQEAIQRMKDELHYIRRRLVELETGGLDHALNPVGRTDYRSLPTQAWNNYAPLAKPLLADGDYELVRDAFMDVDKFNRSVIYFPAGPSKEFDINALRRTLDRADEALG